jgi:hypothetical protein
MSLDVAQRSVPDLIAASRPLAEAHRLELALFVAFEEAALSVCQSLRRHALTTEARRLAAGQADDEARHLDLFGERLEATLAARPDTTEALLLRVLKGGVGASARRDVVAAVVIPPLRRFLNECQQTADAGAFVEALALFNLVLKGMAGAIYTYEVLYWRPADPGLADLIRAVAADEDRHVAEAALFLRTISEDAKRRIAVLCADAYGTLHEVFRHYIRKLVGLFHVIARLHDGLYSRVEFAPGLLLRDVSENEQAATLQAGSAAAYHRTLAQAGIPHGRQEPLPHA